MQMTTPLSTPTLNQGQQEAADGFFKFLFSPDKELIISGTAGVGKTFLLGHILDHIIPEYERMCSMLGTKQDYQTVVMTATTNKAAEVLSTASGYPVQTIHSFLNLRVVENYKTGHTELRRNGAWKVHTNVILFIDECSMIDGDLRKAILEGTNNCKIVYVGDHLQLPPVMENLSPIYRDPLPFFELTQPMRNSKAPALQALCLQLRNTVETGVFHPIQLDGKEVIFMEPDEVESEIHKSFVAHNDKSCVIAYTNATVNAVNEFIRTKKGLPSHFVSGEEVIFNRALTNNNHFFSAEEQVEVVSVDATPDVVFFLDKNQVKHTMEVRNHVLKGRYGSTHTLAVPENKTLLQEYIKYMARLKDWERYFWLQKTFPDLRPRYAATVHKSQGSTFDSVFVDMADIATCTQAHIAARLLYVAASRPQNRIIFYGKQKTKYGEFIS